MSCRAGTKPRRRAAVAVQVAVMITVLVGFTAFSFDVGVMYNTKTELQRTVDAAALAAASRLAAFDDGDPLELARQEATGYVNRNAVFGKNVAVATNDVEFGRAVYNAATGSYDFTPTTTFPDAVRVRLRLTNDSPNGPVSLYFAKVLGIDSTEMTAEATAMMVPRDIAIVADISGSHTDDSELAHYKITTINLHEVWDGFPGGKGDTGSTWAGTEFADDAQMAGPAWGYFKKLGYGTLTVPSSYSPSADPGLVYLPYNTNWSNATLQAALTARGYNTAEVNALMNKANDTAGYWDERVEVALGLADWNSGISGGRWSHVGAPAGNGNTSVGSSEMTWTAQLGTRSLSDSSAFWKDYVSNYMKSSSTEMYYANSAFRYRFGVKTFINYLLENRADHASTPELAACQEQPMQAVKDSVSHLADTLYSWQTDDQLSLEVYGTTAHHEVDLTSEYSEVQDRLNEMQAGYYDTWTNMGGGIGKAITELTSERARPIARKVMIVLTDGMANVTADGHTGDYTNGPIYARTMAQQAVDQGIMIFCVSVGADSDQDLMGDLAELGSGQHFHAEGTIDQYSAELDDIFERLGGTRPVELIK
jgi:Flp pilus assembly protein TadG